MAFRSSQTTRIILGAYSMSAYARTASGSSVTDMHDVSAFTDVTKQFIPTLDTSTFSIGGPLEAVAASQWSQLALQKAFVAIGLSFPITYMPLGVDGAAWLIDAFHTSLDDTTSHSGGADWSLTAQTNGITDINGVVLENAGTLTATADGTAHNNGAGTSNGAVFHVHTTAYSGLTSDVIIIEGSTTGAFSGEETTIATFTTVAGLGSQRLAVTGTVPRYLRAADTIVGTGSITRTIAVSRR